MTALGDGMVVARIVIERVLDPDGQDVITFEASDGSGETLPLVTSLGLLRMSEDTAIRLAMDEGGDQ